MTALEWSQYLSNYKSMGLFQDTQGRLTRKSLVGSCRITNPFKMLWLFSLSARIKKIQSKMKELERSQGFLHYDPNRAICCHGNQSSELIWPETLCSQSHPNDAPDEIDYDRPAGLRDIHV